MGSPTVTSRGSSPGPSYDQLSTAWAEVIVASGLGRGEHLAVYAPDGVVVHVAFLAAEKAGVVAVGIGARAGASEAQHLATRTGCRAVLTGPGVDPAIGRALGELGGVDTRLRIDGRDLRVDTGRVGPGGDSLEGRGCGPSELSIINSTSGTTGMPKCVMHNQNRWWFFHQLAVEAGELSADDVFFDRGADAVRVRPVDVALHADVPRRTGRHDAALLAPPDDRGDRAAPGDGARLREHPVHHDAQRGRRPPTTTSPRCASCSPAARPSPTSGPPSSRTASAPSSCSSTVPTRRAR